MLAEECELAGVVEGVDRAMEQVRRDECEDRRHNGGQGHEDRRPRPRTKPSEQKFVERKLYPGYVFIEMELEEDGTIGEKPWFLIKETTGVGDFIGSQGKPVPMSQSDVDKMLMQVERPEEAGALAAEFKKGEPVRVKEGHFENFEGAVDEVLAEKGLIRVILTVFGRATPVELEYWQVEKS
jgi:transcriptional antiterminator NusG